jgi:regulatory protein
LENFKKALNYAFLLLKYRLRSKKEITSRLKKKGYSLSVIEKVIKYLEENGYINDETFAYQFVTCCLEKGWGKRKIEFYLKKLGISDELIENALNKEDVFRDKLREIIDKRIKYYKNKKNPYQKILKYLLSKGFEYQDIIEELEDIKFSHY